jgi:hypothetical protein
MLKLPSTSNCFVLVAMESLLRVYSGRLSEILRHEAALLDHIVTDQRYYPDYYRVAFYGNFPVAIRGKHFIVSLTHFIVFSVHECFLSTGDTNGRNSVLSVKECSTNIQGLNCSRPWGIHRLIFGLEIRNIFNVQPLSPSQIAIYPSSGTQTFHWQCELTMNDGKNF